MSRGEAEPFGCHGFTSWAQSDANPTVSRRCYVVFVTKHWPPPATTKAQVETLRKRDGGRCWLCDKPIDFKAEPNSARAPSLEHLIPLSREGPRTADNLVLCHPPCNRELGDLPLVEKIKMREERLKQAWKGAMRKRIGELLVT